MSHTWIVIAFVLTLTASLVGLALKDVRVHGVTLAISLVMLVLMLLGVK